MGNDILDKPSDEQDNSYDDDVKEFEINKSISIESINSIESSVVFLPENDLLRNISKNNNNFVDFTKDLLLELQENDINATVYDDGKDKRVIKLHSADLTHFQYLVVPTILFLNTFVIPTVLGLLSNWIYDNWIKNDKSSPILKFEYAQFDDGKIVNLRKIQGTAEDVCKVLKEDMGNYGDNDQKTIGAPVVKNTNYFSIEDFHKTLAEESLKQAKDILQKAEFAFKRSNVKEAESLFRQGLYKIREAVLCQPEEDNYREYLYEIGRLIHDSFGCQIKFNEDNKTYIIDCPVKFSNVKFGVSPGMSVKAVCSICGKNILDCTHVNGKEYNGVVARIESGECNICLKKECDHVLGNKYDNVEAIGIATDLEFDHLLAVDKPLDPRCSIIREEIPQSRILEQLPDAERKALISGKPFYCHHCVYD